MYKRTKGEKAFDVSNIIIMILLVLIFFLPFWTVFATSFVGPLESARRGSYLLYPEKIDINCYRVLLSGGSVIFRAYAVTIFRTAVGTLLNLIFTVSLAYGLSKRDMPLRKQITAFVFFPMLFSGGMIPTYLLVHATGIYNTIWALIIPGLVNVWNAILMRNFFMQIPESLEESARIDGASTMTVLLRIILPLSKASIATIGLFYAVAHWNSWFDASMYINNRELMPLQIILRSIVLSMSSSDINNEMMNNLAVQPATESMKSAAIIVSTIPIICVYPFLQKYFVKGVMVGSVKG